MHVEEQRKQQAKTSRELELERLLHLAVKTLKIYRTGISDLRRLCGISTKHKPSDEALDEFEAMCKKVLEE